MTGKFIYVFDAETRDKLLASGYVLLKTDENQKIYVFENKAELNFASGDFSFVLSDTLTF